MSEGGRDDSHVKIDEYKRPINKCLSPLDIVKCEQ